MGYYLTGFAMLAVVALFLFAFVRASPIAIANVLRMIGPVTLCLIGLLLTAFGRAAFGLPMFTFGVIWLLRNRRVGRFDSGTSGQKSTVRSSWLEMQLDHDTGEMDGLILAGEKEGRMLSDLQELELMELYHQLETDDDSAALLEAYLDRRISGWREHSQTGAGNRERSSSGSGPMSKEEAYQILGLDAGASSDEIRSAHRRLMKAVHPDSGGSTFLASRINEAKDTLLK